MDDLDSGDDLEIDEDIDFPLPVDQESDQSEYEGKLLLISNCVTLRGWIKNTAWCFILYKVPASRCVYLSAKPQNSISKKHYTALSV